MQTAFKAGVRTNAVHGEATAPAARGKAHRLFCLNDVASHVPPWPMPRVSPSAPPRARGGGRGLRAARTWRARHRDVRPDGAARATSLVRAPRLPADRRHRAFPFPSGPTIPPGPARVRAAGKATRLTVTWAPAQRT